jgi:predicted AAA+ superfamily ATPase
MVYHADMKDVFLKLIDEFRQSKIPAYYRRDFPQVPIDSNKMITLMGPRRAGKSTFMYQLMDDLVRQQVPAKCIFYFNIEDDRLNGLKAEELDDLLAACRERAAAPLEDCYFFFDEVQQLPLWDKFLRRVYDTISTHLFVTGSNARLLSKEIPTHLRGRSLSFSIMPFTFAQYCDFKQVNTPLTIDVLSFLRFGGFPEVVKQDNDLLKIRILQEYFDVMVYRDLIERHKMRMPQVLKPFVQALAASAGKLFSVLSVFGRLKGAKVEVSKNTLYKYLETCQSAYVVEAVEKYHTKVVLRKAGERKVYLVDSGYLTALNPREDLGTKLEHAVYWQLRYQMEMMDEIYFFKEAVECDFVIKQKNQWTAIQVAYDLSDPKTAAREVKGLTTACKSFGLKAGWVITMAEKKTVKEKGIVIHYVPFGEWARK